MAYANGIAPKRKQSRWARSLSYLGKAALDATYDAPSAMEVDPEKLYRRCTEFMT